MLLFFLTFGLLVFPTVVDACSVLFYVDAKTGKIYAVNSEDYWFDVEAYI